MYYTSGYLNYSIKEQLLDIIPIIVRVFPMVIILGVLNLFSFRNNAIEISLFILLGFVVYFLTNIIFKSKQLILILKFLQKELGVSKLFS